MYWLLPSVSQWLQPPRTALGTPGGKCRLIAGLEAEWLLHAVKACAAGEASSRQRVDTASHWGTPSSLLVSPQLSASVLLPGDQQFPTPSFILRFATQCGCQWSLSSSSYSRCCHAQSFLLGTFVFFNFSCKSSPCRENNRTKPGLF